MKILKKIAYRAKFKKDAAPGLDAINRKERELYGDQEPDYWATIVPYELGGKDPLWAIDCYISKKQQQHFHHISLGFTNLFYDDEFAADDVNGFGFELTFRHLPFADDPAKPLWPASLMQNLAKYVFESQKVFDDYHTMSANGPIRLDTETNITAIIFFTDPEMGEINSPHGRIKFLQLYGITTQEYLDIKNGIHSTREFIKMQRINNPLLITDLLR